MATLDYTSLSLLKLIRKFGVIRSVDIFFALTIMKAYTS
jgi:hypothetical protein